MLINCPECNKEISNKSDTCIHCGYPLKEIQNKNICLINGIEYNLSDLLPSILKNDNKTQTLIKIRQKCNLQISDASALYNIIVRDKKIPNEYKCEASLQSSQPKCITCGSTNIKRISATSKVADTVAFGLLGTKRHKTFSCCNCGYEW